MFQLKILLITHAKKENSINNNNSKIMTIIQVLDS